MQFKIENLLRKDNKKIFTKTLFCNKLKRSDEVNISQKKEVIFNDPNTFLTLPEENTFKYGVGKKLTGPRYDEKDNLIPYSIVGNFIKKQNSKICLFSQKKSILAPHSKDNSIVNLNRKLILDANGNNFKEINDLELKELFKDKKELIKNNKTHGKTDIILDKFPKIVEQYVNKTLNNQEKNLRLNELKEIEFNETSKRLKTKISLKKKFKNLLFNEDELTMDSTRLASLQHQAKNVLNRYYIDSSINQYKNINFWPDSLRNDKSQKIDKLYNKKKDPSLTKTVNYRIAERIYDNSWKANKTIDKFKKTQTYRNFSNYKNLETVLNKYFKTAQRLCTLEVTGRKLIDFEEKLNKTLKGKKKLLIYKYDKDSIRDFGYATNYSIGKKNISKNFKRNLSLNFKK